MIMAEHGAHITSAGEGQPSVYEVLAQEGLSSSLRLAFNYAAKVLAQAHPARFGTVYRYADELYVVFNALLESYYLKRYSASFAENFYSLKRSVAGHETDSHVLPKSARAKSLFFLVALPYLRSKLTALYEGLKDRQDRGLLNQPAKSFRHKLERLILWVYPILHLSWEAVNFALLFSYVVGHSTCHSLALWLCGLRLQNLSADDIQAQMTLTPSLDLANKGAIRRLLALLRYSGEWLASGMTSALSLGVFFLQFLQHWYSAPLTTLTSLPTPRSPPQSRDVSALPAVHTICPLCHKMRTNHTVLAVTGYVFCYPCIYRYVQQNGKCPITSYPATTEHLVKIYLQSD